MYSREDYNSRVGGFPKPGDSGAPDALWGKRGWRMRGIEDLFPGRDFSGARMRGRPIPREILYDIYTV